MLRGQMRTRKWMKGESGRRALDEVLRSPKPWQRRAARAIEFRDMEAIGVLGKTCFRGMMGQKAEWDGIRKEVQDREMQIGRVATLLILKREGRTVADGVP